MTDDDLDRALAALPLEEPPADLRARILAATVHQRPAGSAFRPWELAVLVVAIALVAFVAWLMLSSVPDLGLQSKTVLVGAMRALGLFSFATYLWLSVGLSAVWGLSSLPLMPAPARTVYNR